MKGDILLVDDRPENLTLLEKALQSQGYQVRSAINGILAFNGAKARHPDLVLLDVDMPEMDGYTVCQAFKADPDLSKIPIIFVSALGDTPEKLQAFERGAVDYVTKPFQIEEMMARVELQLTLQRQHQKIEAQNQALELSNRRLEQFCAAVSHDLKQPLQSLLISGEILERKYGNSADKLTKRHLQNIAKSAQSMHRLMQGLLNYALAGVQEDCFEIVDIQKLIEQSLENLTAEVAKTDAQVEWEGHLPIVLGNPWLLLNLIQNLIDNAIKFRHKGKTPLIRITAQYTQLIATGINSLEVQSSNLIAKEFRVLWKIGVHDNGLGMTPHQCSAVFEMFRRFQDKTDYPGHGIGLATCQKIIEYHGGKIWAESQLNQGSSIYFTLVGLIP